MNRFLMHMVAPFISRGALGQQVMLHLAKVDMTVPNLNHLIGRKRNAAGQYKQGGPAPP
jgi:hypothetical protein